jgi:putative redox protein
MITSTVEYQSNLRTVCLHIDSQNSIITDAPKDNNGEGAAFSPTDLVATSLAACMLTIVGIRAGKSEMKFSGGKAEVTKHMTVEPRRISQVDVHLIIEGDFSEPEKKILELAAKSCPVAMSLHPDLKQNIQIQFKN